MYEFEEIILDQRRGKTVDSVATYLRQGILGGRFAPGQRLISRELVEELGISRGPLREAFRRLAADGLVELIANRGATVRRFSRAEIENIFPIREMLEGLAAYLAAKRINLPGNRERFEVMWDKAKPREPIPPAHFFIEENRSLHRVIVEMSGNPQLGALIDQMALPVIMFQLRRLMTSADVEHSMNEHGAIGAAILAGDAEAAEHAMRRHLRQSASRFMKLPAAAFRPDEQVTARG